MSPDTAACQPPHDRPTVAELLEAVEELLRGEVTEAVGGRLRFHVRVAANVIAMVARQAAMGSAQERAHARRLERLGVTDDAELAAAIRSGTLDARYDEVREALRLAVADKLAVANPRYASEATDPDRSAPPAQAPDGAQSPAG